MAISTVAILGLFFGTIGTTLGGLIGIFSKRNSNRFLSFVLAFASGLMLAVICFDLIPEAIEISSIYTTILGIILGIIIMVLCDNIVKNIFNKKGNEFSHNVSNMSVNHRLRKIDNSTNKKDRFKTNDRKIVERNVGLLKTGIIVSIGLALHNIPEGLAIGSGFDSSTSLGLSLAIAICLHDIPEGISMAVPMKNGGMSPLKVMIYVILSGIATGIGALIGAIVGNISIGIIAICLSFAAGAMLYIVTGELIPEANELYKGRITALGNMMGFIIGLFAMLMEI